jgi:hypothetical protein
MNVRINGLLLLSVMGLVSCNVSPTESRTKPSGEDSTADQAVASTGSDGFSLSMPYFEDVSLGILTARLQVYSGEVKAPVIPGCEQILAPPGAAPGSGEITTPGGPSLITDLPIIYKPHEKIGPVKLADGLYTAVFTIAKSLPSPKEKTSQLFRFAVASFKVDQSKVTDVVLNLRRPDQCKGGGVIFHPKQDPRDVPIPLPM